LSLSRRPPPSAGFRAARPCDEAARDDQGLPGWIDKELMKPDLDPIEQTTCMKCRAATARYYGKWASEGLCRACVKGMPAEIRLKVLRDMHPADRKRWQLDGLLSTRDGERPAPPPGASELAERDLSKMLEAVETGGEEALSQCAATIGAKVVVAPGGPTRKER